MAWFKELRITLVGAFAFGAATLAVVLGWLLVSAPFDGARLQDFRLDTEPRGIILDSLNPVHAAGRVRAGDVLTAVDNRPVVDWLQGTVGNEGLADRWAVGRTLTYTVVRDGASHDLAITLEPYPIVQVLAHTWPPILFALVFEFLAVFVFVRRPRDPAAQALLIAASGTAVAAPWAFGLHISSLLGGPGLWLRQAVTLGYVLLLAGLLHFVLVFPRPQPIVGRWPWLVGLIYLLPLVAHGVYVPVWRMLAPDMLSWAAELTWVGNVNYIVTGYGLLIMLGFVGAYINTRDVAGRRQIRWVVFGSVTAILAYVLMGTLPELLVSRPILDWNTRVIIALLIPITIVIGILRYKLFEIDLIINRTLVYVPLTAFLAGMYTASITLFQRLFVALTGERSDAAIVLTTLMVAALFTPVKSNLQTFVDKYFKDVVRPGHRLKVFSAEVVSTLNVVSEGRLIDRFLDAALADAAATAGAVYVLRGGELVRAAARGEDHLPVVDRVPLTHAGRQVGFLDLGPRLKGYPYTEAEKQALAAAAAVVAEAILTIRQETTDSQP